MISEIKAASDTRLHQYESISSLVPLKFLSSRNSDNIRNYRSGNNISSRKKIQNSIKSISDNHQKFSYNDLINTHFPIVNIQQESKMTSEFPTVPKQAGTFIHRLVNKFFSMTNTNANYENLSRIKRKQMKNRLFDDNHTFVNLKPKKPRRQRLKAINQCVVCRRHQNCFSMLPSDSLEYPSQSPMIFNTNATTNRKTHSILTPEPSLPLSKIHFEKLRTLNPSQYQTIVSAVELIFDTLISNY